MERGNKRNNSTSRQVDDFGEGTMAGNDDCTKSFAVTNLEPEGR